MCVAIIGSRNPEVEVGDQESQGLILLEGEHIYSVYMRIYRGERNGNEGLP
tara:strand:- start:63 stop:215 length:153 start_codon:yes stop_codon:yes gene_type:complete